MKWTRMVLWAMLGMLIWPASTYAVVEIYETPRLLNPDNTNGFVFAVDGPKAMNGSEALPYTFAMDGQADELECTMEIIGEPREIEILLYVDCIRADIVVDGARMHSFPVHATAGDGLSLTRFTFQLADAPDPMVNHRLSAALLLSTDRHVMDEPLLTMHYGAVYEYRLQYGANLGMAEPAMPHGADTVPLPDFQGDSLYLNTDPERLGTYAEDSPLVCAPGETVRLHYRVGGQGRGGAEAHAILMTLDQETLPLDGGPYLLVKTPGSVPVQGSFTFTAPMEPGDYEVMAWSIHDPFSPLPPSYSNHWLSPRFTLRVQG